MEPPESVERVGLADGDPTVLVVDDEPALAELYAEWLRDYDVLVADGGERALELVDEADVVLLDREMPGLGGDEVLERIRAREVSCQVAMVTGVKPDLDVVDLPFDAYLVKPVSGDDLRNTVERLLARRSYADLFRTYFALVRKRSLLLETHPAEELLADERFRELERRIDETNERLRALVEQFAADDVAAVIGDDDAVLDADAETVDVDDVDLALD
ncbi:MAG: response regulator [Haloferacaceae archaeon]